MSVSRRLFLTLLAASAAGCASAPSPYRPAPSSRSGGGFADIGYATWTEDEPDYRLYPGDEIEVSTPTAPELSKTVKVGPDGRIALPLIGSVMAADRSPPELQAALSQAYASQLVRPVVEVRLSQAAPLKVFVGGEVAQPGVYDMPGDIDALQAVLMAGGLRPTARSREVVILRRGAGGRAMMRTVDLAKGFRNAGADRAPLRRFDVIYVPRSGIGEVGAFMQQVRDTLPIGFSYSLNGQYR